MTGSANTLTPTPLSEKLSLVTHHHLLTRVLVKLGLDDWNYGSYEFFFDTTLVQALINDEDVVHYALEGLPKKYNQVCGYMRYRDTFPDLKIARSLLNTEEIRLKSKSLALTEDSSSSSPLGLMTQTNFRFVHDHNAKIGDANGSKTLGSNNNEDLLIKLIGRLGLNDTKNATVSHIVSSPPSKSATVANINSLPVAYDPTGHFTPSAPTYGPMSPFLPA
ncbi:hypothetical protein Tco_0271584 [Tanacetum coccineum]